MRLIRSNHSVFLVLFLLAACGGSDPAAPPGAGGGNGGDDQGRTIKEDPSFSADVMEIFERRGCTSGSCHGGGEGELTMTDASTTHANLVGVVSPVSGEVRVIPGDADNSYLVKKLRGTAAFGDQMPQGAAPLDDIDMTNVENWIDQGAENN